MMTKTIQGYPEEFHLVTLQLADDDGPWDLSEPSFRRMCWAAKRTLPGNVRFAVRREAAGHEIDVYEIRENGR